ncbi:MAG: patatin-like phospholipase family protein [Coriobacteriia bacterium]|nr:patatin-like phospholipase family protein [Coriobacteriia bacterium]
MRSILGRKRIGLALGSGAARGLAHIGVLKVLEAADLAPDVVTGTSMGAMVGALYAAGIPLAEIEQIALDFDIKTITGVSEVALAKGAVFSGDKVQSFLREHLPATFEELRVPFGCVATDLTRNVPVRFTSGDLIGAIRASVSVPLAFVPVRMDDMLLVDGYVCDPVPVDLARHLGGQTIVAVEVCGSGTVELPQDGDQGVARQVKDRHSAIVSGKPYRRGSAGLDIMGAVSEALERRVAEPALRKADVVISPGIHYLDGLEYGQAAAAIEAGEEAALAAVGAVRRKARR